MLKKTYQFLKIALWSCIGVFIGSSIFKYYDYKTHPGLYAMNSAPWYVSIEVYAAFTGITVFVILVALWFIRKKI